MAFQLSQQELNWTSNLNLSLHQCYSIPSLTCVLSVITGSHLIAFKTRSLSFLTTVRWSALSEPLSDKKKQKTWYKYKYSWLKEAVSELAATGSLALEERFYCYEILKCIRYTSVLIFISNLLKVNLHISHLKFFWPHIHIHMQSERIQLFRLILKVHSECHIQCVGLRW